MSTLHLIVDEDTGQRVSSIQHEEDIHCAVCDIPEEGFICSSNPDYSYNASRSNGVNHIQILITGKQGSFSLETTDKYAIATDVAIFVVTAKKLI